MSVPPLFEKVDCIRLYVSDLDEGLQYYREQLGHELLWRTDTAIGLRMPGTDAEIVLHTERIPPEIDIKVDSVDGAVERIEKAGGRVIVQPFDIQIGRCAVVQDPWDNRLVILDISKGLLATDSDGTVIGNLPQ